MRRSVTLTALLIATIIRLAALPLPGTEDMTVWKIWSFAGSEDVLGMYGVGGDPPERRLLEFRRRYTTVDYPPVALYEMAAVGTIYGWLFPDFPNDWRLNVAVKLPGFLAGLALTTVLFVGIRCTSCRRFSRAAPPLRRAPRRRRAKTAAQLCNAPQTPRTRRRCPRAESIRGRVPSARAHRPR